MNQPIDQRNDKSMFLPYRPPSDSVMASPNQLLSTNRNHSRPTPHTYGAQGCPFTQPEAPAPVSSRPKLAVIGWRDGPGMK
ncbi:hypothetical protein D3C72_2398240 [compost metagenome]